MKIDLKKMSRSELIALQEQVATAIREAGEREKQAALAAAQAAAKEHGFSLEDLTGTTAGRRGRGGQKSKSPARYRNPEDPSMTWSGRGRKPGWIKAAEAAGTDIADFAI